MYHYNDLYAIAEVPMHPHGWILNGWLSSITSMMHANEILKNKRIKEFIKKNIYTLEKVINKYDASQLKNSRYNLTQFFWFKLLKNKFKIKSIKFIYEKDAPVIIEANSNFFDNTKKFSKFSKWQAYVVKKHDLVLKDNSFVGSKYIQFNGILSRNSNTNIIEIEFENKINLNEIEFLLYIGKYNPLKASPINAKWQKIQNKNFSINDNVLKIKINIREIDGLDNILGYPTNFIKKFKNGRKNVYHDIHIAELLYIGKKYNNTKLINQAQKFLKYKNTWENYPAYKKLFKEEKIIMNNKFLEDMYEELEND